MTDCLALKESHIYKVPWSMLNAYHLHVQSGYLWSASPVKGHVEDQERDEVMVWKIS